MIELKGKKILVLGATGFIGEQTAIKISQLGAKVIISGKNEEKLKKVFSKLEGIDHKCFVFDILQKEGIKDLLKEIVTEDNIKLSGLVYCVGLATIRPLKATEQDFLQDIHNINFSTLIEFIRHFTDKRVCPIGSIVCLSSIASIEGEKGQLAYSSAKGAIDSSITVLAKELISKNIRINSIRPAALLPSKISFDSLPLSIKKTINDMKTGPILAENIAEHISFLLSDYSSGITGQCHNVRGYLQ